MLRVEKLNIFYGRVQALWEIDLEVAEREIVAIIGPNGAGKSTLLRAITGLLPKDSGRIFFRDKDIGAVPVDKRVGLGLSMIPEGREVFADLSVVKNLRMWAYHRIGRKVEREINEEMKIAAAHALADLAKEEVPDVVCNAYGVKRIEYGPEYLIPKPFDPRVLLWETTAVARAACETGVARKPIKDFDKYWEELESRLGRLKQVVRQVINKAKRIDVEDRKLRIAFPEGTNERIIRASRRIVDEGIGTPVLMGVDEEILKIADRLSVNLEGMEIINPLTHSSKDTMIERFFELRCRRGINHDESVRLMQRRHYYGPMLLLADEVDVVVCGQTRYYPDSIRPALQIIPLAKGIRRVSGLYMLMFKDRVVFLADTTVNIRPDAETLAEIAMSAMDTVKRFDIVPKVAMLSFSNFGSVDHPLAKTVRDAAKLVRERRPDAIFDGEMQANTAINEKILRRDFPFSKLQDSANLLIFPDVTSGNIAYKLLIELGGAEAIGPILTGFSKPYHVLQRGSSVEAIVDVAAIGAVEALEKRKNRTEISGK